MAKYQVYGLGKGDRSVRISWLLGELGIPCEFKKLDWDKGDLEKPEYTAMNPMAMSPTMIEDGRPTFESVACMLYLADKYRNTKALAPSHNSPLRAQFMQTCLFVAASVDHRFNDLMILKFMGGEEKYKNEKDPIIADIKHMARILEKWVTGKDYIVGNEFSAADILVASMSFWLLQPDVCPESEFPTLNAYCTRLTNRPAAKATEGFTE